jgi:hypothetical protein
MAAKERKERKESRDFSSRFVFSLRSLRSLAANRMAFGFRIRASFGPSTFDVRIFFPRASACSLSTL